MAVQEAPEKLLTINLYKHGRWYAAEVEQYPEVHTQGRTPQEAAQNALAAVEDVERARRGELKFQAKP